MYIGPPPAPVNVLDHGIVRLVDFMGSDLSIVRAARVSYDAEWRAGEDDGKDAKLIDYLVRNYHTSPLEQVSFTFEVKAPIFVFRQWHRHRTWSFDEVYGPLRRAAGGVLHAGGVADHDAVGEQRADADGASRTPPPTHPRQDG